ncbi:MAG TPA: type II secretion system protein [Blastocatellia bacterium]|nr:type II secretion system protein [Blastocatellia bacterium]
MNGRRINERSYQSAEHNSCPPVDDCLKRERGFTLFELVMVMTIMVILATISVVSYQHIQLKAKEEVLKQDLKTMRKLIDEYQGDRAKLPQSLDDLVSAGYMREVPVDPITGDKDWITEMGEDTVSLEGGQGMVDVHSNAQGEASDGTSYKDF